MHSPRGFKHWPGPIVIYGGAIASALLSLYFFAPRFWLWPLAGLRLEEFIAIQPEFHRAFYAIQQLQHPFMRIDDAVNRVIEWRLFWPSVGHLLGFSNRLYFAVPNLGAIAALVTSRRSPGVTHALRCQRSARLC